MSSGATATHDASLYNEDLAAIPLEKRTWGTYNYASLWVAMDRTARYPAIAAAVGRLRPRTMALDGEVIVRDGKGVSRFQLLQQGKGNPEYAVFDCMAWSIGTLNFAASLRSD